MPKKRRKLCRQLESNISQAFKKVELISAKINDIQDEAILNEYHLAFAPVKNTFLLLSTLYDSVGITPDTEKLYSSYLDLLNTFEDEYET